MKKSLLTQLQRLLLTAITAGALWACQDEKPEIHFPDPVIPQKEFKHELYYDAHNEHAHGHRHQDDEFTVEIGQCHRCHLQYTQQLAYAIRYYCGR